MSTLLQNREEESPPEAGAADYFVVVGEFCTWYVSTPMARFIEECLDARKPPKWVKFVDLIGSRIRLRTRQIEFIAQCTAEQREVERAFFRAIRRERRENKEWDESS
jgi:hypothetical protein